jgi:hypothetical protein
MNKARFLLTALTIFVAASAAQSATVNFDSGSSKMNNPPVVTNQKHSKHKIRVKAHRSNGRLIKGH